MRSMLKKSAAGVLSLPFALIGLAFFSAHTPSDIEYPVVNHNLKAKPLKIGQSFKVLSWNLQYCGSRKHNFFYDGGAAVHVPRSDVVETMEKIQDVLEAERPEIAFLQEVDRDSARTARIDQVRALIEYRSDVSWSSTPYHRSPFVPAPFANPLGKIDLHLALASAFKLTEVERRQLALLDEPKLRQMFNLKRALQTAKIPIHKTKRHLYIAQTHLSAFSYGDGTLKKQIGEIIAWIDTIPSGEPWLLAGDFNMLPPADDPSRLQEGHLYADTDPPIDLLVPKFKTLFKDLLAEESRTYFPFGAEAPDRKIDYVFYGGPLEVLEQRVIQRTESDHLPIVGEFKISQ